MQNISTSFYYDPIRQGYDTNSWRTLSGAPAIGAGGRLLVEPGADAGSTIHYGDILKGRVTFNVNVPSAPGASGSRTFGLYAPNSSAYIYFSIDDALTCETSDGTNTTVSSPITWDSSWTGVNIKFVIQWEAGGAKFLINGTQVYSVSDASVSHGPLSLYLADNSAVPMSIGDIFVRGTQSFVMSPKTSDTSSYDGLVAIQQTVTVTESVTMKLVQLVPSVSDSVTVSENISISVKLPVSVFDTATITENFTKTIV